MIDTTLQKQFKASQQTKANKNKHKIKNLKRTIRRPIKKKKHLISPSYGSSGVVPSTGHRVEVGSVEENGDDSSGMESRSTESDENIDHENDCNNDNDGNDGNVSSDNETIASHLTDNPSGKTTATTVTAITSTVANDAFSPSNPLAATMPTTLSMTTPSSPKYSQQKIKRSHMNKYQQRENLSYSNDNEGFKKYVLDNKQNIHETENDSLHFYSLSDAKLLLQHAQDNSFQHESNSSSD
ncbi:hypothetical protein RFI_14383 [Reticulomyxa filosa]|uniref:Uncharacterized protein n=1 Tax=Reticulomyxa filosa TaxID=46433 RepID=X6N940_RETFI|nr:hypothetical protein RFI_14383 [Reticulomyxa filosa]|eukprot:ETO22810.1 hypothetical protein RFI_14383 [Reticulomyxa filosa]